MSAFYCSINLLCRVSYAAKCGNPLR